LIKAGTVRELSQNEGKIDRDVYSVALRIVSMLDEVYGGGRDVDNSDGGFLLLAETVQDLSIIDRRYVRLEDNRHEAVDIVKCGSRAYLSVLFLNNNEFGINVLMPIDIAPASLLGNLPKNVK